MISFFPETATVYSYKNLPAKVRNVPFMLSLSACRSSCRVALNTLLNLGSNCALRDAKLIVRLYAHSHIWRCAEVPAESELEKATEI